MSFWSGIKRSNAAITEIIGERHSDFNCRLSFVVKIIDNPLEMILKIAIVAELRRFNASSPLTQPEKRKKDVNGTTKLETSVIYFRS